VKTYRKADFPLDQIRRYLEPGPIVLVTSAWRGKFNIMTMGWHMMLEFSPALLACYIWNQNHSFEMIRRSRECVINIPTVELIHAAVGIGNCSGANVDKFKKFGLTPAPAEKVSAPLIEECYASFECRLHDGSMIRKRGMFIWEAVKAHVARVPKYPKTFHYRGEGVFMVSGRTVNLRRRFRPENL
jgi:flavin reductase (DIM6/NTAB) family NADH-FMN oxidoreductase RutF